MNNLVRQLQVTKKQQPKLAALSLAKRNLILKDLAKIIIKYQKQILMANAVDLKNLKRLEMRDRLLLNEKRIASVATGLKDMAKLPDPLNKIMETRRPKNGLQIQKVSVPLGVVGLIYESRPNITIDLAAFAIKSGNAIILKGGSEAYESNKILVTLIHQVIKKHLLPIGLVYLINPDENWKEILLNAHGLVDVIIPRGGHNLIEWVRENSRLPTIEMGAGVCHTFVDADAHPGKSADIIVNAKVQRPSVCNALDTLVIHQQALKKVLPLTAARLVEFRVEICADAAAYKILKPIYPSNLLHLAAPDDFGKEFLAMKMSIKTVKSFEEGIKFIQLNTSGHSEAILSKDQKHVRRFIAEIDAAVVYVNASTRFTDGGEFGMGAEVGISIQKLHARGPMGLEALTSYKWVAKGNWLARK